MKKFKQFLSYPINKRFFILESIIWLGIFRFVLMFVPFRYLCRYLGKTQIETSYDSNLSHETILQQISHSLQIAKRNVPWECKCLILAMSGTMMLKRRRLPSTLYLGISKQPNEKLSAHAWLRSGSYYLSGAESMDEFKIILTLAQE